MKPNNPWSESTGEAMPSSWQRLTKMQEEQHRRLRRAEQDTFWSGVFIGILLALLVAMSVAFVLLVLR